MTPVPSRHGSTGALLEPPMALLLLPAELDAWLDANPLDDPTATLVAPVALLLLLPPPADADVPLLLLPPGRLVATEDPGALLDRPEETTPEEEAPPPDPAADDDAPPLLVVAPPSTAALPARHTPLATSHVSPPGHGLLTLHTRWQLPARQVKPPSQSCPSWHW